METFYIPTESDFRKWMKEAIKEYFDNHPPRAEALEGKEEPLLSRKEMAGKLRISLVTLTDWVKRGLPCHKQRGRVYFIASEVLHYIREKELHTSGSSTKFHI